MHPGFDHLKIDRFCSSGIGSGFPAFVPPTTDGDLLAWILLPMLHRETLGRSLVMKLFRTIAICTLFSGTAHAEQAVDGTIDVGDYDGEASMAIRDDCTMHGSINFTNRVNGHRIVGEPVSGRLDCRTLSIRRAPPGGTCSATLDSAGSRMDCTWNGHGASVVFNPPLQSCGC